MKTTDDINPKKSRGKIRKIKAGIQKGFVEKQYGGNKFLTSLIELIKNSLDWHAQNIWIITNPVTLFRVVDDGSGMNDENTESFCWINKSAAKKGQSGYFGSGRLFFLYTYANKVIVRTVSKDDPNTVCIFTLYRDTFETIALTHGEIEVEYLPKDSSTWPYPFKTGSEITYELRDSKNSSLIRGTRLADELHSRLARSVGKLVKVDGQNLPEKEIEGQIFATSQPIKELGGLIEIEIYRPKKRVREKESRLREGLRITAGRIGEVFVADFYETLEDKYRSVFPEILLHPEVCGLISVAYLREHYANQQRTSFSSSINEAPETKELISFLRKYAAEIQRKLKIKLETGHDIDDNKEIEEVVGFFNSRYNPSGNVPSDIRVDTPDDVTDDRNEQTEASGERGVSLLRLQYSQSEYEQGEDVLIRRVVHPEYVNNTILWKTTKSKGRNVRVLDDRVMFIASEIGIGQVEAALQGTNASAIAEYSIVTERKFHLNRELAKIQVGEVIQLFGINADKLKGKIVWSLEGDGRDLIGQLTQKGSRVSFKAAKRGIVTVRAKDSNSKIYADCKISIESKDVAESNICCIRGYHFRWSFRDLLTELYPRPATIKGNPSSPIHELTFNRKAPGYIEAKAAGMLQQFLMQAVAQEFALFLDTFVHRDKFDDQDPRDIPGFMEEIAKEGYKVFQEVLGALNLNKVK